MNWLKDIELQGNETAPGEWSYETKDGETTIFAPNPLMPGRHVVVAQLESSNGYDTNEEDAAFICAAKNAHIANLKQAVVVAYNALLLTQHSIVDEKKGFVCPMCCESQASGHVSGCVIGEALAQLQSGKFLTDENVSIPANPFTGFKTFYDSSECETDFVVPKSEMTVEDFCTEANRVVKEVWGLEEEYKEKGYPFSQEHVKSAYVVFNPHLEFEGQKGLWMFGKQQEGAIEVYQIDLE